MSESFLGFLIVLAAIACRILNGRHAGPLGVVPDAPLYRSSPMDRACGFACSAKGEAGIQHLPYYWRGPCLCLVSSTSLGHLLRDSVSCGRTVSVGLSLSRLAGYQSVPWYYSPYHRMGRRRWKPTCIPSSRLSACFPANSVNRARSYGGTTCLAYFLSDLGALYSSRCSWRKFSAWLPLISCFGLSRPRPGSECVSLHKAFHSSSAAPTRNRKATRIAIRPQVCPVQRVVLSISEDSLSSARGRRPDLILVRPLRSFQLQPSCLSPANP